MNRSSPPPGACVGEAQGETAAVGHGGGPRGPGRALSEARRGLLGAADRPSASRQAGGGVFGGAKGGWGEEGKEGGGKGDETVGGGEMISSEKVILDSDAIMQKLEC